MYHKSVFRGHSAICSWGERGVKEREMGILFGLTKVFVSCYVLKQTRAGRSENLIFFHSFFVYLKGFCRQNLKHNFFCLKFSNICKNGLVFFRNWPNLMKTSCFHAQSYKQQKEFSGCFIFEKVKQKV